MKNFFKKAPEGPVRSPDQPLNQTLNVAANQPARRSSDGTLNGTVSLLRFRIQALVIIAVLVAATVGTVNWKGRQILSEDRLNLLADASMKQIAPLKHLVQGRMESQRTKLVRLATEHSQAPANRPRLLAGYELLSLVENKGDGQWKPAWVDRSAASASRQWPSTFEQTLLRSLPFTRIRDGETVWVRVSDPAGAPIYGILISVEIQAPAATLLAGSQPSLPDDIDYQSAPSGSGQKAVVVGLTRQNPLLDVTEDYIGSTAAVFLVDDKGYLASHVNKSLGGELLKNDPIVHELLSTRKMAYSGRFINADRSPVLGHFEKIDRSNLFAVISVPLSPTQEFLRGYEINLWLMGGLIGLLAAIAVWLLSPRLISLRPDPRLAESEAASADVENSQSESNPFTELALKDASTSKSGPVVAVAPELPERAIKSSVPKDFAAGFAHTVKEPLLAILGHVQLIKGKTDLAEIKGHAESVDRETRRVNELVGRLDEASVASESAPISREIDVREVVEKSLVDKQNMLKDERIKVVQNLVDVPHLRGSDEQLKIALDNVLDNAREAMRKRPKKSLQVELSFDGQSNVITITDSGVGMSRDVHARAFEPFFKGFESAAHAGMGLTFVQIAVRRFGGSCKLFSSPGEGTKVILRFPVGELEKRDFQDRSVVRLAETLGQHLKADQKSADEDVKSASPPVEVRPEENVLPLRKTGPQGRWLNDAIRQFDLDAEDGKQDDGHEDEQREGPVPEPVDRDSKKASLDAEDDEDGFSSLDLALSRKNKNEKSSLEEPASKAPDESSRQNLGQTAPASASGPEAFQVKIRRPRVRS